VRIFVATQPIDGRKGVDSLAAIVRSALSQDPLSGHLYVFFSRRCDRVRVVYWDRNGFAMWTKMEKMIKALEFLRLVTAIVALVRRMRDINFELTKKLTDLRRARPRSETLKRVESQCLLPFTEGALAPPADSGKPAKEPKPNKSRKGVHPGRAAPPAHLPRVEVINAVPPAERICPLCGREMTTVGHETCEIIEIQPARIVIIERKDERVACPHDDTIVSAKTPPQIVERGKLGDTLVVEAVADKFLEHQPTERQSRRFLRAGVPIAPQTLGRSMGACIDLLAPIARMISAETLKSPLLATDASGLPVLDEDHPLGIRNGTMWCWVGSQTWVTFVYARSGDSQSVKDFLGEDLCRTVQCDGTSITSFLERAGGARPGCWAHGRRRFVACARSGDTLALVPLRIIRRLFAVERLSAIHGDTADARLLRRNEHSSPVLDELDTWLKDNFKAIPPKTPLGKAVGYLLRQWKRLVLFLTDGRIELTNNRVERELRSLVLGRKNWLFAYGDLGGERAATILTVLGTCISHRINPRAYLHVVTKLIVNGWPNARLRELLPDRIAALHPELRLAVGGARPLPSLPAAPS
jgi:transposase